MEPETDDLWHLHEAYMGGLTDECVDEYLLECHELGFLKGNDVGGWKARYQPVKEPPLKRKRMSPDAILWTPNTNCGECGSAEVIDDVKQGQIVCTNCGLVQSLYVFTQSAESFSDSVVNRGCRKTVHRYSRIVYFRSLLQGMAGETAPTITETELDLLKRVTAKPVTPKTIQTALASTKLLRLRRHRERLAELVSGGAYKPVVILHSDFVGLLKNFRRVEFEWDRSTKHKFPERKVFLSYSYVFYQLCYHMKCMQYTGTHHLLKGRQLREKQHRAYVLMCEKTELTYDATVVA